LANCTNGVQDQDESDVDCGGSCAQCLDGEYCYSSSDCASADCVSIDDFVSPCAGEGSLCRCVNTLPPTDYPTHAPTFSPPIVIQILSGNSSEVDPTRKVTLGSEWISADPLTQFEWSAIGQTDTSFSLSYGTTTLTSLENSILVVAANALTPGQTYTFSLTAENRYGKTSTSYANVTAANPPSNGSLAVTPESGTTLSTSFEFLTSGWTDDPESYPLSFQFVYFLSTGAETRLESASSLAYLVNGDACKNYTLPLGLENKNFSLAVGARVTDLIGASALVNTSIIVGPPSLDEVLGAVENTISDVFAAVESGDSSTAALSIQSSAAVLNYVFDKTGEDDDSSDAESTRQLILNATAQFISAAGSSSPELAESQAVSIDLISSGSPDTFTLKDQVTALNLAAGVANALRDLGQVSDTAAASSVSALSNVLGAGILEGAEEDDNATTTSRRRLMRRQRRRAEREERRRLEGTSPVEQIAGDFGVLENTLLALNGAITADLAAGEDAYTIAKPELASTNAVMSETSSRSNPEVAGVLAESSGSSASPSFAFPDTLFGDIGADGPVSIAAAQYASDPHAALGGATLQDGAAVTSLSINSFQVGGLSQPIILTLPFPAGANTAANTKQTLTLNCSKNFTATFPAVTEEEQERADFCGYPLFDDDLYEYEPDEDLEASIFCEDAQEWYNFSCVNVSGIIDFTCPQTTYTGSCEYWSPTLNNWTDDNCTLWYVDLEGGFSVCNCTHLTGFVSQQKDVLLGQIDTFTSTVATADDLSVSDVQRNIGILVVLFCVWVFCLFFLFRDKWKRKKDTTVFLFEIFEQHKLVAKFKYARTLRRKLHGDVGEDVLDRKHRRKSAHNKKSHRRKSTRGRLASGGTELALPASADYYNGKFIDMRSRSLSSSVFDGQPMTKHLQHSSSQVLVVADNAVHTSTGVLEGAIDHQPASILPPVGCGSPVYASTSTYSHNRSPGVSVYPSSAFSHDGDSDAFATGAGGSSSSTATRPKPKKTFSRLRSSQDTLGGGPGAPVSDSFGDRDYSDEREEEDWEESAGEEEEGDPDEEYFGELYNDEETFPEDEKEDEEQGHEDQRHELEEKAIEEMEVDVTSKLRERQQALAVWWENMKAEHDIVSFFTVKGSDSKAASKRGIVILMKILSFMFMGCLNAPDAYLCPDASGSFLPLPQNDEDDFGTFLALFFRNHFMALLYQALMTAPLVYLVGKDLAYGDMLEQSDELLEERLLAHDDLGIFRPDLVDCLEKAVAAMKLLKTLRHVTKRQLKRIKDKGVRAIVLETLRPQFPDLSDDEILIHVRMEVEERLDLVEHAVDALRERQWELKVEVEEKLLAQRDVEIQEAGAFPFTLLAQIRHYYKRKAHRKQIHRYGLILAMPKHVQFKLRQHDMIRKSFKGAIFGVRVPILSPMIRAVKVSHYTAFSVTNIGLLKTQRSRDTIAMYKQIASISSILLLLFFTFYIFLYVVQLNDNKTSIAVLYGLLFAESVEIFFAGPLVMLIFSCIIPAIIACVLFPEVIRIFHSDTRVKMGVEIHVAGKNSDHIELIRELGPTQFPGSNEEGSTPRGTPI